MQVRCSFSPLIGIIAMRLNAYLISLRRYYAVGLSVYIRKPPEPTPGIAHMVEHLPFRCLAGLPQKEFYYQLDLIGCEMYACTDYDYVRYEFLVHPCFFERTLFFLSQLFADYQWTKEQVHLEKDVVRRQIENKFMSHFLRSRLHYYKGTPYGRLIMGARSDLDKMSVALINDYKRRMFQPANSCLVLAGAFTDEQLQQAYKLFGAVPKLAPDEEPSTPAFQVPLFGRRDHKSDYFYDAKYMNSDVHISFDVDLEQVDYRLVNHLTELVGEGTNSRLTLRLREELGLTDEIEGNLDYTAYGNHLYFNYEVYEGWLHGSLEEVFATIQKTKQDITERDVKALLPFFRELHYRLLDYPNDMCYFLGERCFINGLKVNSLEELIEHDTSPLQAEALRQAARTIFRPENLAVYIKADLDMVNKKEIKKTLRECRKILEG